MFGSDERNIAPTPRRLAEARRAGLAPLSQQLTTAVTTCAGFAALGMLGDDLWRTISDSLRSFWSTPVVQIEGFDFLNEVFAWQRVALFVAVILTVPMLAAVFAAGLQRGFRFRFRYSGKGWQEIDPRTGLRRVGGGLRFAAIGGLTLSFLSACLLTGWVIGSGGWEIGVGLESYAGKLLRLLVGLGLLLAGAFLVLGIGDWIACRRRFQSSLRMTAAEAREEARAAGSPRRTRTRRPLRVSDEAAVSGQQSAAFGMAGPVLPSDPLIP